ncbi:MAG TPA: GNAT family N-acetyltransferase [Leptolyngbyaceae cyanobacterium M65_K2018_010]|nr:GNAT family N-acetyltransferase [Leptolyngbyaceae cyanobacterium M65_K2018_010]
MTGFAADGYHLRQGSPLDRATLVKFMAYNYQELGAAPPPQHLAATVDRYLSCETPVWFVEYPQPPSGPSPIAALWLGQATDQRTGLLHPYLLLLYVDPDHRRRGLATALLQVAHQWAEAAGHRQMSLQVFSQNQAAQALYHKMGYQPEAILMRRSLGDGAPQGQDQAPSPYHCPPLDS